MSVELIVPTLGESITEATVSKWLKNIGDNFNEDEPLVEIETDKITVEVSAPKAGVQFNWEFPNSSLILSDRLKYFKD